MTYYEEPSDRSDLAKLLLTLLRVTKQQYKDVHEALKALKDYGKIYVKCVGYREIGSFSYPRFKIVTDVLPSIQAQLKEEPGKAEALCPNCNRPVTPDAKFCSNCGFKLRG